MKTIAVILAGGVGKRIGSDMPKQLLKVNDKYIIEYTIEAFEQNELIDEICIVSHKDYIDQIEGIVKSGGYRKIGHIIEGGKERSDSSMNALKIYTDDNDILLFHDAARPLVSQLIITNCIEALSRYNAVGVAVAATDTIWQSVKEGILNTIPPRETLYMAQTPQGFRRETIARAYQAAKKDKGFRPTDDCSVVAHYLKDEQIRIIKGDNNNIKITFQKDLYLMQVIINERKSTRC